MDDNFARYRERREDAARDFELAVSKHAYDLDAEAALAAIRSALTEYRRVRFAVFDEIVRSDAVEMEAAE